MSVGFGFSVGDFLAALKLVGTVIDALREFSHASSSFRSLINELYALESVLLRVKRLDLNDCHQTRKLALKSAASQCQDTIDAFWKKIQKYQPHLQQNGTDSRIKDGWAKVKWAVCKKKDLETFRAQIRGHTSSIEMLLLVVQMEATTMDTRKQDSRHKSLASMIQDLSCQAMGKLSAIADSIGQSVQQGKALLESSAQIVQTNLRVFQIVHDIHLFILRIPGQVQRQQPVYLIDVYNKESPFHLEFVRSAEALLAVLKVNLRESGCGPDMIDRGEFVIEESGTQNPIDITGPWDSCFYPGQRVAMSMLFKQIRAVGSSCPRCGKDHEEPAGKEITCIACGVVFRRIEEVAQDIRGAHSGPANDKSDPRDAPQESISGPPRPAKRKREDDALTNLHKFRRIQVIDIGLANRLPIIIFECAFWFLDCSYISQDVYEWRTHCLSHFRGEEPPRTVQCPLCYDFRVTLSDGWTAWNARTEHIAFRHMVVGGTLRGSRPDFHLFQHLWQKRLIDDNDLKELMGESTPTRSPASATLG